MSKQSMVNPKTDPVIASGDGLTLHSYSDGKAYYIRYSDDLFCFIPFLLTSSPGMFTSCDKFAIKIFKMVCKESRLLLAVK